MILLSLHVNLDMEKNVYAHLIMTISKYRLDEYISRGIEQDNISFEW